MLFSGPSSTSSVTSHAVASKSSPDFAHLVSTFGASHSSSAAALDFATEFPLTSRRRKFQSDYVSREDYFSHHPPPPSFKTQLSAPASQLNKPSPPPKPQLPTKPQLQLTSSSAMSKVYPETDDSGSINIYATLPRRPKNRGSSAKAGVASNSQTCSDSPTLAQVRSNRVTVTSSSHANVHPEYYNWQQDYNSSRVSDPVTSAPQQQQQQQRMFAAAHLQDNQLHDLSVESMVTQQLQQVAATDVTSHLQPTHNPPPHKQGPRIQRFLPQQSVTGSALPVYPYPPCYQTNGRQVSVESGSSSVESGGSHLSKLEAHQLALLHPNEPGSSLLTK